MTNYIISRGKLDTLSSKIKQVSGNNNPLTFDEMISSIPTPSPDNGTGQAEDVTAETNIYTTKLVELNTAITELEQELEGKAAGNGGSSSTYNVDVVDVTISVPSTKSVFGYSASIMVEASEGWRAYSSNSFSNTGIPPTIFKFKKVIVGTAIVFITNTETTLTVVSDASYHVSNALSIGDERYVYEINIIGL